MVLHGHQPHVAFFEDYDDGLRLRLRLRLLEEPELGRPAHGTRNSQSLSCLRNHGSTKRRPTSCCPWPDFNKAVASLQQPSSAFDDARYEVCQALADGTLIVKQCLIELYTSKHPEFRDVTEAALAKHNDEFNVNGLTAGGEDESVQNGGSDIPVTSLTFSSKENAEEIITMEDASHGLG